MRILPLILTVLLASAWAYTSWYWYTCNIKWFCWNEVSYTAQDSDQQEKNQFQENLWDDEIIDPISSEDSPKLSAEDVLFAPQPQVEETEEIVSEEDSQQTEDQIDETSTWASIETSSATGSTLWDENADPSVSICDTPLIWPIGLWRDNDRKQVESLELFLISRWESVEVDWVYGQEDFDAIKRFQLEYKQEVLEPWGIQAPTWYVWKTSIQKINEIACK